jgi:hypothetical protein
MTEDKKNELIEEIKCLALEMDPCIELIDEHEDKLIGVAERFGCHFIPLYKGVNTFLFKTPKEAIEEAVKLSDKTLVFDGLDSSIIGYVVFDGGVAILHDKEVLLENLASEYEKDGMEIDEEYESYYSNALDWYDHNIIGTGLSDMTTPAFALTEDFSILKEE